MSLSTYIGVAVVLPCVLAVFMCSVACSSGDQSPQSASCRTAGVPLISLTSRTLHQPQFLSELCFPGRQTGRSSGAALHTALLRTLLFTHTHHWLHYVMFMCTVLEHLYWCLEWCCRTVTAHSPPSPSSSYVRRRFFPFYLRNVGVSFKKPEADGTVISHSFWHLNW